jgi:hypothetical protein
MNDAADEPSNPTSAEPEFRRVSYEEMQHILENHKKWLAAEDRTPPENRVTLHEVYDYRLRYGTIQAENESVDMRIAGPFPADLFRADLRPHFLEEAQLQGADLVGAQLQGAALSNARLDWARLYKAQLQEAQLYIAQLQGVNLGGAQLQGATLTDANFDRLSVTEDGEPGQDLPSADLTDADFREAGLSNAQLKTVSGLRAEMLAGAVLTNAKLPEDVAKFDRLTHVAEISKHAGTTFFALLAASLYCWLTIGTTTDVALITGAATRRSRSSTPTLPVRLLLGRSPDTARCLLLPAPLAAAALA